MYRIFCQLSLFLSITMSAFEPLFYVRCVFIMYIKSSTSCFPPQQTKWHTVSYVPSCRYCMQVQNLEVKVLSEYTPNYLSLFIDYFLYFLKSFFTRPLVFSEPSATTSVDCREHYPRSSLPSTSYYINWSPISESLSFVCSQI